MIYQHIYCDKAAGGDSRIHPRQRLEYCRKRGSSRECRGRSKDQLMIDQRPKVVGERSRIGDWEMDTVFGRPGGSLLVTMIERVSHYTVIRLVASKDATAVDRVIISGLREHRDKIITKTYDNGKEFAHHKLFGDILEEEAYFPPNSINHGSEALIRTPTDSSASNFQKALTLGRSLKLRSQIKMKHNRRPFKCLYYQNPNIYLT